MSRRPLPAPSSFLVGAVFVTLAMGAIGFLPLFGGPGYEQSLATGLIVPSAVAIATSISVARGESPSPLASVGRGVLAGLAYIAITLVTALLHGARIGICEWWGALLYFALTAGIGSLLAGAWGAIVGEVVRVLVVRKRIRRLRLVCVLLSLAGPIAGVIVSVWRFYSSAMIFAFDPFVGYFSGSFYDTVIDAGTPLLTYRLGTFCTLTAIAFFASILLRNSDTRAGFVLDLRSTITRVRFGFGFLALIASGGIVLAGSELSHWSTTETIIKDLGAEKHGARCDVVYPSTTREQEALLLVKDCEEEIAAVEKRLGTNGPARIRAFFFRDENDKKRLMGAAHTYIAKPWREEVYLQLGAYPHPVLGHELAHVIAGSFGHGPFKIGGEAGGYLPNPGLIEGVAVMASPEDEDLTGAQWARAMMQIGILPSMQRVFSLNFLGDASAKSYTLAGAFITWLGETLLDMKAVQAWYGGGNIETIAGKSWPDLDQAFHDYLKTVPLPSEAESFARAKFARPGLFGRKCPHVVDAMRHEADVCRDTQRFEEAIRIYTDALSKDPQDYASRNARAATMRRHADREKGRADLESLASREDVPRTWRDRADEALADADFIDGNLDKARVRYDALASRSLDEDAARTLEVKRLGTEDPSARASVTALLLGDEKHGPDIFFAGVDLGRWPPEENGKRSPLASYLIGRNLVQRGFFEAGADELEIALAGKLPTQRIARETLRQRAMAACAVSDQAALSRVKAAMEAADDPFQGSGGRRDATLRMIVRCTH